MQTGVYMLVAAFILGSCSWFDDVFLRLRIRKSYALMLIVSLVALCSLIINPTIEFGINPASLLLMFALLVSAVYIGEYSFLISLFGVPIFTVICLSVLFYFDFISPVLAVFLSSVVMGLASSKRPFFGALCSCALPLVIYVTTVFIELSAFVPYGNFSAVTAFDAQIIALMSSLMSSYIVLVFRKSPVIQIS